MGKKNIRFGIKVIVLTVLLSFASTAAIASDITDNLKATIDKAISIVTDESLKDKKEMRRQKLRVVIEKQFNYKQMVMRSLAKNWKDRSPEERKEFIRLFKKLLENSYASKLESYSDETINYVDEIIKGKYALVKTEIVRKDATIAVEYKLINENGQWLVYDFVIEGVSIVHNYKSQFTKIIHKESYEALVQKLANKIKELELGNANSETL